jgi:lia operon protein LiaG
MHYAPTLRRNSRASLASIALLAVMFPGAAVAHAQEAERYSLSGNAVAIYNLAGSVRIEAGTGANVVVDVSRGGRDAGRLNVERREIDGNAGLVVRYPAGDVVYSGSGRFRGNSTVSVRDDGTFFGRGSSGRRVNVRSSGNGTDAHADLRILVPEGRTVLLRLGVGDVEAANVNGALDIDVGSAAVTTARTRGNLRIDTGSGRVRVSDAEGDVLVDTGSGSVDITNIRGSRVHVDTGSGSVTGSAITTDELHVDTGSGSIRLAEVAARDLLLDTGSGSVDLDLTTNIDRVRIDTGSGSVRLAVPAGFGAALDVSTGSGGITTDLDVNATRRTRSRLVGTIGSGGGSVEIDTGSGGVRIRRR